MILSIDTELLVDNGFTHEQINRIQKHCICGVDSSEKSKHEIPVSILAKTFNVHPTTLTLLTRKGILPTKHKIGRIQYYNLVELLERFWKTIHKRDIDKEIKEQKRLKLTIDNQKLMNKLIPKADAEERSLVTLQALARMMTYAKKSTSQLVVGCSSAREAEKLFDQQFKTVFESLENECKKLEWNEEEGATSDGYQEKNPIESAEEDIEEEE